MFCRFLRPLSLAALLLLTLLPTVYLGTARGQMTPSPVIAVASPRDFGALPLRQTSPTGTFTFQFDGPATIGAVRVVTEGQAGGEFKAATSGMSACHAGSYTAGSSCTVAVAFMPVEPGMRRGAILLLDASGQSLATAYLSGTGLGSKLLFTPGSPLSDGPITPGGAVSSLAISNLAISNAVPSGAGTLYTNEGGSLVKRAVADGTVTTLLPDAGVSCLATDGAGYVYACVNGAIAIFSPDGMLDAGKTRNAGAGSRAAAQPVGIAVDASGALFMTEHDEQTGVDDLRRVALDGSQPASAILWSLPAGELVSPGVAVDAQGEVFLLTNRAVREVGTDGLVRTLAAGNYAAASLALDAGGTLYAPTGELAGAPGTAPAIGSTTLLGSGQSLVRVKALSLALDGSGNLTAATAFQPPAPTPLSYAIYMLDRNGVQSSPAFLPTLAGQISAPLNITLQNGGNESLELSSASASAGFSLQAGSCAAPIQLASGAGCTLRVAFAPLSTGPITGILTLTDDSGGEPESTQTIALAGTGLAPQAVLSFSSGDLHFGNVLLGEQSRTATVTITNTGTLDAHFGNAFALTGAAATDFVTTNGTCSILSSQGLAPEASCTIQVSFVPGALGQRQAVLSVSDDLAGSPQQVVLSGTGTNSAAAAVEYSFTHYDFGPTTLGRRSGVATLTIVNAEPEPVLLAPLQPSGPDAAEFAVTANTCATGFAPAALPPGGSCTLSFVFTPAAVGTRTATLSLRDSGASTPIGIDLSGTGMTQISVTSDPSAQSFGAVNVGSSVRQTLGFLFGAPTTVSGISAVFAGAEGKDFQVLPGDSAACRPGSYAAGATCSVTVSFAPAAPGLRAGALLLLGGTKQAGDAKQPLVTAYLSGMGGGPLQEAGTPVILGAFSPITGVFPSAVDGNGVVYLAVPANLYQPVPGLLISGSLVTGSPAVVVPVGIASGLAIDGAGNLYLADSRGSLRRRTPAGVETTVGSHTGLTGVAVDGAGDVFATDPLGVYRIAPDGSETTLHTFTYLPETQLSTGPTGGIAVDTAGTVHITTCYGTALLRSDGSYTAPAGRTCAANPQQELAIDARGDEFIATAGGSWQGVGTTPDGELLYVAYSEAGNTVYELPRSTPGPDANTPQTVSLSWPEPATVVYGTPLTAAQLRATTVVPGSFDYSPSAGTILSAGPHTLVVTFTPVNTHAYATATGQAQIMVTPAPTAVVLNASAPTANLGVPVTLTAAVPELGAVQAGTVSFSDGSTTLGTVTLPAQGPALLTTTGLSAGVHTLTAVYSGDANHAPSTSAAVSVAITASPAVVSSSSPSLALGPGQSSGSVTLTMQPGAGFLGTVRFGCNGLPAGASCSFLPETVTVGSGATVSTVVTLSTGATAQSSQVLLKRGPGSFPFYVATVFCFPVFCLPRALLGGDFWRRRSSGLVLIVLLAMVAGLYGCGGPAVSSAAAASAGQTAPASYQVTVTATGTGNATFAASTVIHLTVHQ